MAAFLELIVHQDASFSLLSILVLSIDREEELVNLSLLPVDTGKPDVLPESLHLPLRLAGEEKRKYDSERMKKKRKLSESEQVIDGLSFRSLPSLHLPSAQNQLPALTLPLSLTAQFWDPFLIQLQMFCISQLIRPVQGRHLYPQDHAEIAVKTSLLV